MQAQVERKTGHRERTRPTMFEHSRAAVERVESLAGRAADERTHNVPAACAPHLPLCLSAHQLPLIPTQPCTSLPLSPCETFSTLVKAVTAPSISLPHPGQNVRCTTVFHVGFGLLFLNFVENELSKHECQDYSGLDPLFRTKHWLRCPALGSQVRISILVCVLF